MLILSPCVTLLSLLLSAEPVAVSSADWRPLLEAAEYETARARCQGWLDSPSPSTRVEARKCLANVELAAGGTVLRVDGEGKNGGCVSDGYVPEIARKASKHLTEALRVAPQDLSLHTGRLHALLQAGLLDEAVAAVGDSARAYKGPDPLAEWLPYPAALFRCAQYRAAIAVLLALDKTYPDDHRIAGNLGAAYSMLENDPEALRWARKAAKLAPDDPIDAWNLARVTHFAGMLDEADAAYQRALPLQVGEKRDSAVCMYVGFLLTKRNDPKRACEAQKGVSCPGSPCGSVP